MDVVRLFPIFKEAIKIIDTLMKHNHQAYFVGGSVRDMLLGRVIGDIDIATSATPEEVIRIFSKTIPVGIQHGTVIVILDNVGYEVTTFRKDENYLDYRRPNAVTFIDSLSEDLRRRDFTMNAIAMDRDGNLIDPYGGQEAIKMKRIETVGTPTDRFKEDALRMMRAIRFHSQLSFTIDHATLKSIHQEAPLITHVSIERIMSEIEKTLSGPSCHSAMRFLVDCELSKHIKNLSEYEVSLKKWPSLDFKEVRNRAEKWALFCFLLNVKEIDQFLKSWKLPVKVMNDAKKIYNGLLYLQENQFTPVLMYQLGRVLVESTERIYSVLKGLPCREQVTMRIKEYNHLPIQSRSEIVIKGSDLFQLFGKTPGPWVNVVLTDIEEAILNRQIKNDLDSIKEWLGSCNRY